MTLGRVVLGVDGSEGSKQAVRWSANLAQDAGTEVILVHGWTGPEDEGEREALVHDATDHLRERDIPVRSVVERTDPRLLLVAVAEREDADLIVVGSRGQSMLKQLALGSVGEYLTHHATCPTAIVPHGGEAPSD